MVSHNPPPPQGEAGEISATSPQIIAGYRNLLEEAAQTLRNGWLYIGDIGQFDDEGYLFISYREKDMVIVGEYNVFPREIDEVLYAHLDAAEAATLGVPDNHYGEVTHAWVTLKPSMNCSKDDLIAYYESYLPCYKVAKIDYNKERYL